MVRKKSRGIHVGPGNDEEDEATVKIPAKKKIELNPVIASFYPKRDDKQA